MATQERSLETKAAPETVWRIWSDTSTWQQWNPDVISMRLDGPFAAGTTGTMTTKQGVRSIRLTEVVPGKSFRLETRVIPGTLFSFQCQVSPSSAGMSRISQSITVQGPLGPIFGPMMVNRIADTFQPLLRGLAAKAEGGPSRS